MNKFSVQNIRRDFSILNQKIHGKNLIYFDNAASSLKPSRVIERIKKYYESETSNIHRSSHFLGSQGTLSYETSRDIIAKFIGATKSSEVVFTRGTTESLNLVAQSLVQGLKAGDEVILSELEHHSNIVPWQLAAERVGAKIRVIEIDPSGVLQFESFKKLLNPKTKILSLTMCSNTLGTVIDVKKYIDLAHDVGAKVVLDAAQFVCHQRVDVQKLDCDFLAFSGHKIFGPYGIGILYGKEKLLNELPPYQGGGSMISEVRFEKTTYADIPQKFEAGTPSIADAIALGEAISYFESIGFDQAVAYVDELLQYAHTRFQKVSGLKILGPLTPKAPIVSFIIGGVHPSDLGSLLDQQGIAIRTGHHCTQPLLRKMGLTSTARASFSIYNTQDEIDFFIESIEKAKGFLL